MRRKLLLFGLLMTAMGVLSAQDTIKTLMITEARLNHEDRAYVELTNMGAETINLVDFEFGTLSPWCQDPLAWIPEHPQDNMMLGEWIKMYTPEEDTLLGPGESFVIATAGDFGPRMWLTDPLNFPERIHKEDFDTLANLLIYNPEGKGDETDSITPGYGTMEVYGGRDIWYVRHHLDNGDSVVVDQVNGVFDQDNDQNWGYAYDCAGFVDASNEAILIRRFSVKQGNLDYNSARGLDLADSEWMPIDFLFQDGPFRAAFWTVGNHGDYNLTESTLVPKSGDVDLDYANQVLTVPWGTRKNDSVMFLFEYTPGLAWHYDYSPVFEDSAYIGARTGDSITVYACGNDLVWKDFRIEVAPPTDDANVVVPKAALNDEGIYGEYVGQVFDVTDGVPGMDTISDVDFATRTDTLFKYLEKANDASWEFVFVDGVDRPDVKDGDILKVTAKDGTVKDYYIKVEAYLSSDNADLASITWPDIPEFYIGIYGWDQGDTIPGFSTQVLNYSLQVPADVPGIPALVAQTVDVNASVKIQRASNIFGTVEDRTMTFTVTAEDGENKIIYKVVMFKEQLPDQVQHWDGTPFMSEYIFWEQWSNSFLEICNPGTLPLDLSDYMFITMWSNDPVEALTWNNAEDEWGDRYIKYIPGYKWETEAEWQVTPRIAVQDLNVNAWVQPGDVFVMGDIYATGQSGENWFASEACDIIFNRNPSEPDYSGASAVRQWTGANVYMYRILNDSIKLGIKPATDPNDFQIIETFGGGDGLDWVIGGVGAQMINSWVRKPEYYEPKPDFNESFGDNLDNSEWLLFDEAYWNDKDVGWPNNILFVAKDLGKHFMNDVTIYKSTVSSMVYLVSRGYTHDEQIRGLLDGVTVETFLPDIDKADPGQSLTVLSSADGSVVDAAGAILNGDTLLVLSTDSINTTKYVLEVTAGGLSDDAVLTSTSYDITVDGATGTVGGFDYGTLLTTVISNVTLPSGADMNIIDANDGYVPLKKLNFDTAYVDVQVSDQIWFEVIAEDLQTTITYQLKPNSAASDAFVVSDVYEIDQEGKLISFVPGGTTVDAFYSNVTPATGATIQLKDKTGLDRMEGEVYKDDNLLVQAQDQVTENTYFLAILEEEINYLAYVTSNVYLVDQVNMMISGETLNLSTTVADFKGNLVAAPSASISVLNDAMAEKTDGNTEEGDMVRVVAGNGIAESYYDVEISTVSTEDLLDEGIRIYPNPTSGMVRISGLKAGNRIQVYNTLGVRVLDQHVFSSEELVSLDEHQNGLYFVVISDGDEIRGHYKLVVK